MPFRKPHPPRSDAPPARERMALRALSNLVEERTGVSLKVGLEPHLRQIFLEVGQRTGCAGLEHLYETLEDAAPEAAPWQTCAELVTTGESFFFRDAGQVALLLDRILPDLASRPGPVKAWSAGCSRGEEAYTLAILAEEGPMPPGFSILGTDLSPAALQQAAAGVFRPWSFRETEGSWMTRWLEPHRGDWRIRPGLQAQVRFRLHNLVEPDWSDLAGEGPFDLIICRNVFIYFRAAQVLAVVAAFRRLLKPDGYLLVGHGELGLSCPPGFRLEAGPGSAVYRPEERRQAARTEARAFPEGHPVPPQIQALRPSPLAEARSALDHGDASGALTHLGPVLEAPRPPEEAFLQAIHALANQGRGPEALSKVEEGLHWYPASARLHHLASLVHADEGHLEASLAALDRALQLDPRFLPALLDRAHHAEAVGDLAAAREDWSRILSGLDPLAPEAPVEGVHGVRCLDLRRMAETAWARCGGTP